MGCLGGLRPEAVIGPIGLTARKLTFALPSSGCPET